MKKHTKTTISCRIVLVSVQASSVNKLHMSGTNYLET